ncbi:MAG TPA: hypothetical protein VNE39_10945 [Planctomycetota bacterium]|nr:hypothetical protein [Planctomycetota bacterium]
MTSRFSWFPTILVVGALSYAGALPRNYLHVSDIKRGMTGYGLSVFQGTKIERFDVEVLGVLRNAMPKQDIVICRMSGAGLEKTGVIAGMSGSPVYLKVGNEHKLAGAVAYGWGFPKEPVCGLTPIENMYAASQAPVPEKLPSGPAGVPAAGRLDAPLVLGERTIGDVLVAAGPPSWDRLATGAATLYRLQAPVSISGLTEPAFELARRELGPLGLLPVQGGGAGGADDPEKVKLEPGSALAVRMAEGDVEMSGIGTCTDVVGDTVLAFGHPMLGEGRVSVPMATACVHYCFPSQMRSFKLAGPLKTVGRLTADMQAAVIGKLGDPPRMIPVEVRLRRADMQGEETYRCRVFEHPRLTSRIVGMFLFNSLLVRGDLPRENTLRLKATIDLGKRPPIVVENVYAGLASSASLYAALSEVIQPLGALGNNEFGPVPVERVTADLQVATEAALARVEAVRLERDECRPGDTVRVLATLHPHKKEPVLQALELKLPDDFPAGRATVMVCDAAMTERLDRSEAPQRYVARDLDHLVEILRQQVSQRRLFIRMRLPDRGVALRSVELPSLPSSMFSVVASPRTTGLTLTGKSIQASVETPFVVSGSHALPLTVRPKETP